MKAAAAAAPETLTPRFRSRRGQRDPQQHETAQEQRNSLAAQVALHGGERRFPGSVDCFRILVQIHQDCCVAVRHDERLDEVFRPLGSGAVRVDPNLDFVRDIHVDIFPFRLGLHNCHDEGEYRIEDKKGGNRRKVTLVLAAENVIPHHVSGTEKQMGEGALGIVVHERDGLAGAHIHPAFSLPLFLDFGFPPGIIAQFIINGPETEPGPQPFGNTHTRRSSTDSLGTKWTPSFR